MHVKVRPYIWESSNRPMFVRSVWLDNEGHRHVLLDEEVHKKRDVKSMRRVQTEQVYSIDDSLQCIGYSDIGVSGKELLPCNEPVTKTSDKSAAKKLERGMGKLKACKRMCEKSDISFVSLKHHLTRQKSKKVRTDTGETSGQSMTEQKASDKVETTILKEDESHKNQLTERVLQWLDKTGKFTSINPVRKEKVSPLPEINVKDNDTDEELETTEKFEFAKKVMSAENILRPRIKTAVPLRRSESVHTLSLTFDEDDLAPNPYGISRCKSAALRFGDFFPATYKCSKKFLSLCSRKTSASSAPSLNNRVSPPSTSASANNLTNLNELPETTNKGGVATNSIVISLNNLDLNKLEENCGTTGNRNSQNNSTGGMEINNNNSSTGSRRRKILRRKDTLIENQYKHIIHKHILETQCNTQIVKRQLHIFIPKLPKKDKEKQEQESSSQLKPPAQDNECDSCLSTVYSEAN